MCAPARDGSATLLPHFSSPSHQGLPQRVDEGLDGFIRGNKSNLRHRVGTMISRTSSLDLIGFRGTNQVLLEEGATAAESKSDFSLDVKSSSCATDGINVPAEIHLDEEWVESGSTRRLDLAIRDLSALRRRLVEATRRHEEIQARPLMSRAVFSGRRIDAVGQLFTGSIACLGGAGMLAVARFTESPLVINVFGSLMISGGAVLLCRAKSSWPSAEALPEIRDAARDRKDALEVMVRHAEDDLVREYCALEFGTRPGFTSDPLELIVEYARGDL